MCVGGGGGGGGVIFQPRLNVAAMVTKNSECICTAEYCCVRMYAALSSALSHARTSDKSVVKMLYSYSTHI